MSNIIILKGYKKSYKQPKVNMQTNEAVAPRYELFKERVDKKIVVLSPVNVRRGVSILFWLQNIADSIDSSLVTKYTLYPLSMFCKIVAKRHKRKLAKEILALAKYSRV